MRILIAFVIAIALAACGGSEAPGNSDLCCGPVRDMAMLNCPETVDPGDPCPPSECHYPTTGSSVHCSCGSDDKWTCTYPDMFESHD